jgi:hypothetical protein
LAASQKEKASLTSALQSPCWGCFVPDLTRFTSSECEETRRVGFYPLVDFRVGERWRWRNYPERWRLAGVNSSEGPLHLAMRNIGIQKLFAMRNKPVPLIERNRMGLGM